MGSFSDVQQAKDQGGNDQDQGPIVENYMGKYNGSSVSPEQREF